MTYIDKHISRTALKKVAQERFGDMVKGVVDIDQGIMAIGGELHADEEAFLMQKGSHQKNLWGINLYPDISMPEMLEFDSMINIRPSQGNRTRDVEDQAIREKIITIITNLVTT
ncbi:MAG: hypothetical protein HYZ62_01800 [Candidatus Andersenbacteria bacterium]|nr:hypothetical protein [Candidatus Andersenbacteria bacterium]